MHGGRFADEIVGQSINEDEAGDPQPNSWWDNKWKEMHFVYTTARANNIRTYRDWQFAVENKTINSNYGNNDVAKNLYFK